MKTSRIWQFFKNRVYFLIIIGSLFAYHLNKGKGFFEVGFKEPIEFITSSDKSIEGLFLYKIDLIQQKL